MGFSQPELEGLLEKAVLDRKIPLIRGYSEHFSLQQCIETASLRLTSSSSVLARQTSYHSVRAPPTQRLRSNGCRARMGAPVILYPTSTKSR